MRWLLALTLTACVAHRSPPTAAPSSGGARGALRLLEERAPFAGCAQAHGALEAMGRLGRTARVSERALELDDGAFTIAETREGERLYIRDDAAAHARELIVLWPTASGWTGTYTRYEARSDLFPGKCTVAANLVIDG